MNNLDFGHVILAVGGAVISLLFSIVTFFIVREFHTRDKERTEFLALVQEASDQLGKHAGRLDEHGQKIVVLEKVTEHHGDEVARLRNWREFAATK